jgi:serine/threonine-protein kinase
MEPKRWQRLRELFEAASRLEPSLRSGYLDQACADDPDLRHEVESLLSCDARAGNSLAQAVRDIAGEAATSGRGLELSANQMLGKFLVLEKIGEGGMGDVYRAEDTTLEREVALKVLPTEVASDPERLARFEREAKTLAALEHPNIVSIHTLETDVVGESPASTHTVHYLTMQLVEGQRLAELIPEGGMPFDQIIDLAVPLADALAAAHQKGVVHRDLKPSNVMLTKSGQVMVLDFGLAKLRPDGEPEETAELGGETLTRKGCILGTPPYMSPEQVHGKQLDARSDLFSLGVMLYEMATGEQPFQGDSSPAVISSILRDVPPGVETMRPDLPYPLSRLIARCLEKEPEHRYQSADDLCRELEVLKREPRSMPVEWLRAARVSLYRHSTRRTRAAALGVLFVLTSIVGLYLYRTWPSRGERKGISDRPIESLAVLPFDNLMEDPEQDYFVDGMTDALINGLAKIGALKVISRTSAMHYKGTKMALPEIARELGVDVVVEGSVLRAGNEVRITAQLIEASTDRHLWAETYQRELQDVLRLQSELARSIASEIQVQLTPRQQELLALARSVDPEAHDAYLRGRFYGQKESVIGFTQALDYFQQAIEIDPSYAAAHAGLADATAFLAMYSARPPAAMERAKQAALTALELDESLAEAHNSLALIKGALERDWLGAEDHHLRAIELSPNSGMAYYRYSMFLRQLRRYDEAIEMARRAVELDPLSIPLRAQYGAIFYHTQQYDKAVELLEGVLEMDPEFGQARWNLFLSHAANGAYAEAVQVSEGLRREDGSLASEEEREAIERGYATSGWSGYLEAIVEAQEERARRRYVSPYIIAVYRALLGQRDEVLLWLEKAEEEGDPVLPWVNSSPVFDHLRSHPRFQALLRRMNFPE